MAFDWNEYLKFAKDLKEIRDKLNTNGITCSQEAVNRCIVSRAYYAAFHEAKNYAESRLGSKFEGEHVHSEVSNWFKNNKHRNLSDDLRECRDGDPIVITMMLLRV